MKRALTVLLTAMLLVSAGCKPTSSNSPSNGDDDTGSSLLTRGEAVQMFYDQYDRYTYDTMTTYTDISGESYAEAVVWAQNAGLLFWVEGTLFEGSKELTIIECAEMLAVFYPVNYQDVLSRVHSNDPALRFHYEQLMKFAGFENVPDWARDYMLFAWGRGLLSPYGDELRPYAGMSSDELSYALALGYSQTFSILGFYADPYEADYSGVKVPLPTTDLVLMLGMHSSDLTELTGTRYEDDWSYYVDHAQVTFIFNRISCIDVTSFQSRDLEVNGVKPGDTRDRMEQVLGMPAESIVKGSSGTYPGMLPRQDTAVYYYDAEGNQTFTLDAAGYFLGVRFDDDGTVVGLSVSVHHPFDEYGLPAASPPSKGIVDFSAEGTGNAVIENISSQLFVDIDYSGTGGFAMLQDGEVLFSHTGDYSGRILLYSVDQGGIEIRTDGDWKLVGLRLVDWSRRYDSSGSGDYVFPAFGLAGEYSVSHKGSGAFTTTYVPMGQPTYDDVVLVEVVGAYSETMDFAEAVIMFPGYVVITTDGDWTFRGSSGSRWSVRRSSHGCIHRSRW